MICEFLVISILFNFIEICTTVNSEPDRIHHPRLKRQNLNGYQFVDCVLPSHPENGKWEVVGGRGNPKSTILPNTLVKFSCKAGYKLTPKNPFYICDADWNPKNMPKCQETSCPALKSTSIRNFKCSNSEGKSITCDRAQHGSIATVKCVDYYEIPGRSSDKIHCKEGSWSDVPQCVPVCGKPVEGKDDPFTGAKIDPNFKYPWIATLYRQINDELEYICGGNLISDSLILTAAHCVTTSYGKAEEPSQFQISVGKAYNVYGDSRDQMAQYVLLSQIKLHPQFIGHETHFMSDLALLKTKTPIRMSALVQPICLKDMDKITLQDGAKGVLAIWGQKSNGERPDGLKYLEISKDDQKCENVLPKEFAATYNLPDKMCTLLEDEGNEAFCKGFSGSGVAFKNPTDNRYYIHAIVSLAPLKTTTMCSARSVLCTRVSFYYDFITNQLNGL